MKIMKISSLETTCFWTSIFSRLGLDFGSFWEALGPLLGGFGHPKWHPRGWDPWRKAVFNAVSSFSWLQLNFLSIWEGLGRVLGGIFEGIGKNLGRFAGFLAIMNCLCFCLARCLGFWGIRTSIAAITTRKATKLHITSWQCTNPFRSQKYLSEITLIKLWSVVIQILGSLNLARRNARSV